METGHVFNLHSEAEAMTANITFLTEEAIEKQREKNNCGQRKKLFSSAPTLSNWKSVGVYCWYLLCLLACGR